MAFKKGYIPHNKGLTLEKTYGVVKAKEIRKKLEKVIAIRREKLGYINSPKTREKLKEAALRDYKEHPERREQIRKSALEQFKNGMPQKTKKKLSKIKLGKKIPKSSEILKRLYKEGVLKVWNKGKKGLQVAWNKDKPNYKIRGDKNPAKNPKIREKISIMK